MAVNINVPSQVKTYADLAAFPASGALKTIYIAEDTNKTYRWTGSVYVEVSAAGASGITIGTTAITSGTVGRVLFEGTGNVVQESANLFWDNTNGRLGIGTNAPSGKIHVKGSVASEIFKAESTIAALYAQFVSTDGAGEFGIYTDAFYFQPLPSLANGTRFLNGGNTIIMQLAQTGNVGIGTTTDAGYKLDVNGTARISGNINSISSGLLTHSFFGGTGYYALIGTSSSNGQYAEIYRPTSTKTLSINNGDFDLNLGVKFNYTGLFGILIKGTTGNVLINTTTDDGFRLDVNGTARVSGNATISLNQNAATQINISNTTSGSSASPILNLTSDVASGIFQFGKQSTLTNVYKTIGVKDGFIYNGSTGGDISTGNFAINTTTDAGYKLDVNGTARVSGVLTCGNNVTAANFIGNIRSDLFLTSNGGFYIFQSSGATGNAKFNQFVSIGTNNEPVASAALDVVSTTKGFLPPRMTTTQKNAIASPATGLMVYDNVLNRPCFYDGTTWITL
jgi:hypothetical protein